MSKTDQLAQMSYEHPVGSKEIAGILGVAEHTVHVWQARRILPEPVEGWSVSGRPVWRLLGILVWALHTKRLDPFQACAKGGPLYGLLDVRCECCRTGNQLAHTESCTSREATRRVVSTL